MRTFADAEPRRPGVDREGIMMRPPSAEAVLALQRQAGNYAVTQVMLQRTIKVGGTLYGVAEKDALLGLFTAAELKLGRLGSLLFKWLKDDDLRGSFENVDELYNALKTASESGVKAQQRGENLENEAAAVIGGEIAEGGRYGGDPDLKSSKTPNRILKMDVVKWASPGKPEIVGIVGGGAKALNLEKFRGICADLHDLCTEHGARPVVFAAENTPAKVLEIAADHVGPDNVYVRSAAGVWATLTAIRSGSGPAVAEQKPEFEKL